MSTVTAPAAPDVSPAADPAMPDVASIADPAMPGVSPAAGVKPARRTRRWRRAKTIAGVVVALVAVVAIGWAGLWRLQGGKWVAVATPSMGAAAPVGTLAWVEPAKFDQIHVGQIITFHPPNQPGRTYTHRVVARNADGTLTTKGDINKATDPWKVSSHDLVGRVTMRWWGVGWLVRAMPILAGGGILLWMLTRFFTPQKLRAPARIFGVAVLLSLTIYVVKPLVRAEPVAVGAVANGGRATYVSTGLLPVRLAEPHGKHVDLRAGHVGTVVATRHNAKGGYTVRLKPHVPAWWWVVGALLVMSPALWSVAVGTRRPDDDVPATA